MVTAAEPGSPPQGPLKRGDQEADGDRKAWTDGRSFLLTISKHRLKTIIYQTRQKHFWVLQLKTPAGSGWLNQTVFQQLKEPKQKREAANFRPGPPHPIRPFIQT